jgi:hypothetical protein
VHVSSFSSGAQNFEFYLLIYSDENSLSWYAYGPVVLNDAVYFLEMDSGKMQFWL